MLEENLDAREDRRKALFLDRDGTVLEHIPYLHEPEKVRLVKGASEALRMALACGFHLFLFTNQSGVGRGLFTMAEVEACHQRMLALLDLPAPGFTAICIAPEAPGDPVCYRKPSPRFIFEMIEAYNLDPGSCWMIGDHPTDMMAAERAGIQGLLVDPLQPLPVALEQVLGPH